MASRSIGSFLRNHTPAIRRCFIFQVLVSWLATIVTEPRQYATGRYTAKVGDIALLMSPVPLEFIKKNLSFGWLNQRIKSYTTITGPTEASLKKCITEYQGAFAEPLTEGSPKSVLLTAYDRNPIARQQCIAHYGTNCYACGFSFGETYGETVEGFIHVHHLKPMAAKHGERSVDPVQDLRPICPNCHAVVHRQNPPMSITELKRMVKNGRSQP